jgi:CubicO group peptidase (beta-lactamase class C family)
MYKTVAIAKLLVYFFHMTSSPTLCRELTRGLDAGLYGAAAVTIAVDGVVVVDEAVGRIRTWDAPGVPADGPAARATRTTLFDVASLTKLVTAATTLTLLHERGADASLPVAEVLPEFTAPSLRAVTMGHLLDHTAGFPADWGDRSPDPGAARFRAGARPPAPAGVEHRYSCVGFVWAGLAAESLGGDGLDSLARSRVLDPLGMADTRFRPGRAQRDRTAATEHQTDPPRGLVHGEVHDETAWALGGVSGNAGLFSTGRDLLRLAEALRLPPGRSALPASVVGAMTTPRPRSGPGYGQGLGPRIDEEWMRGLRSPAAGHTGFTGTSVATEIGGRTSVAFLSNRVHPRRSSPERIQAMRRRVTDAAAALGVHR